jgi:hypothetical protein
MLESAKATSSLWGNIEISIILLKILSGNLLHDNFFRDVA